MMFLLAPSSLFDAPNTHGVEAASMWLIAAVSGPIALSIATLAVASLGFAMLSGRLEIRRGTAVILGCFVLFGARVIAAGLMGFVQTGSAGTVPVAPPPVYANPGAPAGAGQNGGSPFDPYAGAAVPR